MCHIHHYGYVDCSVRQTYSTINCVCTTTVFLLYHGASDVAGFAFCFSSVWCLCGTPLLRMDLIEFAPDCVLPEFMVIRVMNAVE